jgi:hypothetical protein
LQVRGLRRRVSQPAAPLTASLAGVPPGCLQLDEAQRHNLHAEHNERYTFKLVEPAAGDSLAEIELEARLMRPVPGAEPVRLDARAVVRALKQRCTGHVLAVGEVASPLRDPMLDWFTGAWLGGRVDAMDVLLKLANAQTQIVPAYGAVMTRAQLQAERDLMFKIYERTATLTGKGNSAQDMLDAGVLGDVGRTFQDPYRFLYDVAKGFQAHYTNFGGNVV